MSSQFGNNIKFEIFGQSHGRAIGVLIDGLPAGERINLDELYKFLDRRRPGKNALSTQRKEADKPVFLSGVRKVERDNVASPYRRGVDEVDERVRGDVSEADREGDLITCGSPLCAIIENSDVRSGDYSEILDKPRPGHADYTAFIKWRGQADMRGGGHFSGRLTAPLCIAGGIAKQILARKNIYIGAHLAEVAGVRDDSFYDSSFHLASPYRGGVDEVDGRVREDCRKVREFLDLKLFNKIASKEFPVINDEAGEKMRNEILKAASDGDSVGGIIECAAINVPTGLGEPIFDGVESQLARVLFGVPAVKGVEFGAGFNASRMRGSENNDAFKINSNGDIITETNNSGGILGGITNGMPVIFNVAIKPTPSISRPQKTISLSRHEDTELIIKGRHDPCVAHRAVPAIEAAAACVILNLLKTVEEAREKVI